MPPSTGASASSLSGTPRGGTESMASRGPDYRQMVRDEAGRQGIDPDFAERVGREESNFNPNAVSRKGALGIMQLMPATARILKVNPLIPSENIRGGVSLLKQHLDEFGDTQLAAAAYNAGADAVRRYNRVPPYRETKQYVNRVAPQPDSGEGPSVADILNGKAGPASTVKPEPAPWVSSAASPIQAARGARIQDGQPIRRVSWRAHDTPPLDPSFLPGALSGATVVVANQSPDQWLRTLKEEQARQQAGYAGAGVAGRVQSPYSGARVQAGTGQQASPLETGPLLAQLLQRTGVNTGPSATPVRHREPSSLGLTWKTSKALTDQFEQAKASGDFDSAKRIGTELASRGWEYGIGPGGWPYVKAPSSEPIGRTKSTPAWKQKSVAPAPQSETRDLTPEQQAALENLGPHKAPMRGPAPIVSTVTGRQVEEPYNPTVNPAIHKAPSSLVEAIVNDPTFGPTLREAAAAELAHLTGQPGQLLHVVGDVAKTIPKSFVEGAGSIASGLGDLGEGLAGGETASTRWMKGAGQTAKDFYEQAIPTDPRLAGALPERIAGFVGQSPMYADPIIGGIAAGTQSADATYNEAITRGATLEEARKYAMEAAVPGAVSGSLRGKFMESPLGSAVVLGGSQIPENEIAKQYDPDRGVMEGVPEQIVTGMLGGKAMGSAGEEGRQVLGRSSGRGADGGSAETVREPGGTTVAERNAPKASQETAQAEGVQRDREDDVTPLSPRETPQRGLAGFEGAALADTAHPPQMPRDPIRHYVELTRNGKRLPGQGPKAPYNRKAAYGKTPRASDRALGRTDHQPPLVQRFYEGDPGANELPGFLQSDAERAASAADRSRLAKPQEDYHAQGGALRRYSLAMRKQFFEY